MKFQMVLNLSTNNNLKINRSNMYLETKLGLKESSNVFVNTKRRKAKPRKSLYKRKLPKFSTAIRKHALERTNPHYPKTKPIPINLLSKQPLNGRQ